METTQLPINNKWTFTGVGQSTWKLKKILRYASTVDLHNWHARRKKTVTEAHISIVLFYVCPQYGSLQRQKAQQRLPRAGSTEGRMEGLSSKDNEIHYAYILMLLAQFCKHTKHFKLTNIVLHESYLHKTLLNKACKLCHARKPT